VQRGKCGFRLAELVKEAKIEYQSISCKLNGGWIRVRISGVTPVCFFPFEQTFSQLTSPFTSLYVLLSCNQFEVLLFGMS